MAGKPDFCRVNLSLYSAPGKMLEKGQDTGNPRVHIIAGPAWRGYNPDHDQDAYDPAYYLH
jgi:hypothetical protein